MKKYLVLILLISASPAFADYQMPKENFVALIILAIIGIPFLIWFATKALKATEDPENLDAANLDNLFDKLLELGLDFKQSLNVTVYRQSGNIHKELGVMSAEEGVKKSISTFKRAKIDMVTIKLFKDRVRIWRGFDNGRVQEGKKVGGIELVAVDE